MRFGAHTFLWTDRWSSASLPLMERARGLGLGLLEIGVGDDIPFDAPAIRRQAASLGLEITLSPGNIWPMEADLAHPDPQARQFGLRWHQHWVDQAGEAAATAYTGALYSHPGRVERRPRNPDEERYAAENLHLLAEYGAQRGVQIVIEPMSRFRTHLLNTPEQAVSLLRQADHPNLKVLFDTYHALTEVRSYAAAIHTLSAWLWGLHACENDRGAPGGGLVPWSQVFQALRETHFDGAVVLETYNTALGSFAVSRGIFQNVCPDGDEFVRASLAFLKAQR